MSAQKHIAVLMGGPSSERDVSLATGRGVAFLVARAMQTIGLAANGATAIVQGYGNVGAIAAHELSLQGIRIIGVSDHTAALYDPKDGGPALAAEGDKAP